MIRNLGIELDEERNAASSAANEAMAMILRLQREKAEAVLEARQFKRFAEEKMAHDDEELFSLEDLLMKRDEMLQNLSSKVYLYRLKFQRLGFSDSDLEGDLDELSLDEYPPLKCSVPASVPLKPEESLEISSFGENPSEDLNALEQRIFKLEKQENQETQKAHEKDDISHGDDSNDDDSSDRIYMVDTVYGPSETPKIRVSDEKDVDIKKLYMRLEALEADRESMRQALISMRTEKTQLVLLQEIAQQLSKEVVGSKERREVVKKKKKSFVECFSILTLFKWLFSLVFKTPRIRYTFGLSARNVGLLVILEKTPLMSRLRCSNIKENRINMK
ncbi:hypothetical protein LUZ60_005414 [Juncus effusus]|nr:hypothetical protein LUZ60_005414 [Juncus effusus]